MSAALNHDRKNKKRRVSEDWCFICKDGGTLLLCDHRDCVKAYHSRCLKRRKLSTPTNDESWHCNWHTCSKCQEHSTFFCYCCPASVCNDCLDDVHFTLIKGEYGFCHRCMKLALYLENEEVNEEDLWPREIHFKEYLDFVKEDEGFSLKDLPSPKKKSEIKQKSKSDSNSFSSCDSMESLDRNEEKIKLKRFKRQGNIKLNCSGKSRNGAAACKEPQVLYASIVPDNIKLVYLKRSLVEELLKEPESFKDKVKGSYVRVESSNGSRGKTYHLVQVIGIEMDSSDQPADIKLQSLDWPNDIAISTLSEGIFSEEECEVLRQKMNTGLLKKPTTDELEEKARSLHKDITDHTLATQKIRLQNRIDFSNEKGWRSMFYQLWEEKRVLETPEYRFKLLNTPPKVIPEIPESQTNLKETVSVCKDRCKQKKSNVSKRFILVDKEGAGKRTGSGSREIKSVSKDTDEQYKVSGFSRAVTVYECGASGTGSAEQSSCNPCKESPQNPASMASAVDVHLDELLDQLIKPDVSLLYPFGGSSVPEPESAKYLKDGLLLLKQVQISELKSMIAVTNKVFNNLNERHIDYTSIYKRVRNYIRCSYLLSSTEEFKQCSSVEELSAKFDSSKAYKAMIHTRVKELSTCLTQELTILQNRVSDVEKSLGGFEDQHYSETFQNVLMKLKSTQDSVRKEFEEPMVMRQQKNQYSFEKVWEDFVNAKAALFAYN